MSSPDPISLTQTKRLAANADTILLRATRPADLETPIGAFLRLAAALLSLLRRPDVEPGLLQPWLKSLIEAHERLWSTELDPTAYAAVRTQVNTLTQLAAMLGRESDDKLANWEREIQATLARTAL